MVEIGRPVRINGSIGKIEQTIDFISRINGISNTSQLVGNEDYRTMQKQSMLDETGDRLLVQILLNF